jgi:hypothetical protein
MVPFYARVTSGRTGILSVFSAILLSLLSTSTTNAQLASYSFSQATGTFEEFVPDSTMGDQNSDDNNYSGISIGFPFKFRNEFTEKISVSYNGYVVFGPVSTHTFGDAAISTSNASGKILSASSTNTNPNVAAAFNMDLRGRNGSVLGIKRTGTEPNRVFAVQWKEVQRYGGANSGDRFTFQIRIYETTNVVEFVYGTVSLAIEPTTPLRAQVGLRGASNQEFLCRKSDDDWSATTPGSLNTDGVRLSPTIVPASGTSFRYSPIPPAPNDLGVFSILSPSGNLKGCPLSANEKVTVVVRNYGTNPQTSSDIAFKFGTNAEVSQNFTFTPPLAPNKTDTLTFTSTVNMAPIATYKLSAYSKLANENTANRLNDSLLNYTVQTFPPKSLPQPVVTALSVATTNEWKEGKGTTTPSGTASEWTTAFPYASETMAVTFNQGNTATDNEWLYSPNITVSQFTFLIFKASVTLGAFGSTGGANMGDDTVNVYVRANCGNTWTRVAQFKQSDVATGNLSNNLKEFRVKLVNNPGSAIVAFVARGNGTPATSTYRFHLEDIEFKEVSPNDLGVSGILSPSPGSPGCVLTSAETVKIIIKNYGSGPQSSVDAGFTVNGGSLKTQVFTLPAPIQPGDEDTLTFTGANTANLSTPGTYTFAAFTRLASEIATTRFNDTIKDYQVTVTGPQNLPSVLIKAFADANTGQWKRGRGLTAPSGTTSSWGGSFAFGTNQTVSVFMSNLAFLPIREWIYSPTYQVSSSTYLFFDLAVTSGNTGINLPTTMGDDTLRILGSTDCGGTWKSILKFSNADLVSGRINNTLKAFIVPVSSTNTRMTLGFFADNMGTTNAVGYRFHLDNIQIKNVSPADIGAVRILGPFTNTGYCAQSATTPVKVVVRNFGSAPQTASSIAYTVNGGTAVVQNFTFSPALAPTSFDTVEFTGANGVNLTADGSYSIRAFTQLAGEDVVNAANDSAQAVTVLVKPALQQATYTYNFNANTNLPADWYSETGPLYEYGVIANRGASFSNSLSAGFWNGNRYSWLHTNRMKVPASPAESKISYKYRVVELFRGSPTLLGLQDTIAVYISSDCGANFAPLEIITAANQVVDSNYTVHSFPLTAYAGQEVMLRFFGKIVRADANICFIDYDDLVIEEVTGVRPVASGNWKIYPNPARSFVNVDVPAGRSAGKFAVVTSTGSVIREFEEGNGTEGGMLKLDLQGLAPGFYHLRFTSESERWTSKLLVR